MLLHVNIDKENFKYLKEYFLKTGQKLEILRK